MLPVWTLAGNETWGMHGNHSIPIIADAVCKGIEGIDTTLALQAIKASLAVDYKAMGYYKSLGYVPSDKQTDGAGISLEYYYDDWCAAQLFKTAGNSAAYEYYLKRSLNYPLQFNPKYGLVQSRKLDKTFQEPFESIGMGSKYGFTEGNAWQYSFSVQHDVPGLVKLMGGVIKFDEKLDSLFSLQNTVNPGEVLDVTGVIGLYAHGNEPCHHIPYLYNYAQKPCKTQKLVKTICDSLYTNQRDGICGNDDCGQVSAWYLFSAMGFYPVNPANGVYDLGTPAFEKLTINLDNGNVFVIKAQGISDDNFYVNKVLLNGKELNKPFINHSDIVKGGELVFEMTNKPN
jgi:predicted alpha-1,2-mannosidase